MTLRLLDDSDETVGMLRIVSATANEAAASVVQVKGKPAPKMRVEEVKEQ